jgi:hypothetical protein
MTIRQWWDELVLETRARAQTLAEMNEPFSVRYHVEDDDWKDPRLWE